MAPDALPDPLGVAVSFCGLLEELGVRYLVGGSLASSVHDPPASLFVDTAEHSVLRKLEWYRRGGETSDRQWRDVVAILRVQGPRLDRARLDAWGSRLGVTDLLERARSEVGG